MSLDNIEF